MSVDVELITELGDVLEEILDFESTFSKMILHKPTTADNILSQVDLFGDTYFNRLQMPILTAEVLKEKLLLSNDNDINFLDAVLRLATRCEREVGLLLRFSGD